MLPLPSEKMAKYDMKEDVAWTNCLFGGLLEKIDSVLQQNKFLLYIFCERFTNVCPHTYVIGTKVTTTKEEDIREFF